MPKTEDVSDPTDWISTPVASLEPLEAGLRCEICKDFYTAPVLTACCHTFCSGCIRRSLSSVNASRKCPLCWAPFDEGQLRKNKIVEELVKTFQAARGDILALGLAAKENALRGPENGKKRKLDQIEAADTPSSVASPRKTRSRTQRETMEVVPSSKSEEISSEEEAEKIDDGNVSCPICQQRMPEAQVFAHLDTHSEDKTTASNASLLKLPNRGQPTAPTMTPLPTLSYTLLSDAALRKKLRELGIPADGNKQTMSRRHTEWRNLVNANCDSSLPKSKSDLLRELNQWERTQNPSNNALAARAAKSGVMDKDFDRDDWSTSHNANFQDLIAAARMKAKSRPQNDAGVEESEAPVPAPAPAPEQVLVEPADPGKLNELADVPPSTQIDVTSVVGPDG